MPRTLTVVFRRDPAKDRHDNKIEFEGYKFFWPDGRPVTTGLEAFCRYGQVLLGLGRHLQGCNERLLDLLMYPLSGRDDDLTRLPGHRVRRFFLQRTGRVGRIHFVDGTPTQIVVEVGRDETRLLNWFGLTSLRDGECQWFDLAATPSDRHAFSSLPAVPALASESLSGV